MLHNGTMPSMKAWLLACLPLMIFATGCFTETRTYSLSVRNDVGTPISICLTKMYGPDEGGWESPEELAAPPHPASDQTPPGLVLQPGKTAKRDAFTGEFDRSHGRAILRVYAGIPTLSQMNAISRGSVNRLDVPLQQGENRLDIKLADNGAMTAVRVNSPWPATQPVHP